MSYRAGELTNLATFNAHGIEETSLYVILHSYVMVLTLLAVLRRLGAVFGCPPSPQLQLLEFERYGYVFSAYVMKAVRVIQYAISL